MSEHDLIVVGVDGSDDALRAVRYGAGIALLTGAELLLANAVDDTLMAGAWAWCTTRRCCMKRA